MTHANAKHLAGFLGLLAAAPAAAQDAPTVNGNTGDLTYTYAFRLPKARGRYQPELALVYSSATNRDLGFGHGWSLTGFYVERDVRSPPSKQTLWLVSGTERKLLVLLGSVYRPEVEDSFFEVTPGTDGTFTGKDAVGTTYIFGRLFGSRAWLTRVTDPDGNVTEYAYGVDKSDPTAIRYNLVGTSFFANEITLEYRNDLLATDGTLVPSQPAGVDGGAFISHGMHLYRVRIDGPTAIGSRTTIRGYELTYSPSSVGGATSIARIAEFGVGFADSLPPTQFTYQIASGYSVDAAVATPATVNAPCSLGPYVFKDLDADGRPDIACGKTLLSGAAWYEWLRNVTPVGGNQPVFETVVRNAPEPALGPLMDFDGDGVLDIVYAWLSGTRHMHSVYRGHVVAGNLVWDSTPIVLDVTDVAWLAQDVTPTIQTDRSLMVDLNGDGVMDYARRTNWNCGKDYDPDPLWPDCTWEYGLTELNPGGVSRVVKQAGTLPLVPGAAWYNVSPLPLSCPHDSNTYLALDMNGDGLLDAVWNPGTFCGYRTSSGVWRVALNWGNGALGTDRGTVWAATLNGYADYPEVYYPQTTACPAFRADDLRCVTADLQDFDGDGTVDFYRGATINWNLGDSSATSVPGGSLWAQVQHVLQMFEWGGACEATLPLPDESSEFLDMNGDGIPDLLLIHWTTSPPTILLSRGVLTSADGSALPLARPILLRSVQVPDGAVWSVDYAPSTAFGVPRRWLRPVVTRLAVSGAFVQPNATHYSYAGPVSAPAWYDAAKLEDRGFAASTSKDDVTGLYRYTVWETGPRALMGKPYNVFVSADNGASYFELQVFSNGVRSLGAAPRADCASRSGDEFSPATYPVRVIPTKVSRSTFYGSVESNVTTTIACGDVDNYGNVASVTVTPSVGGVAGKVLATTQTFGPALSACKNVFSSIQVTRWDTGVKIFDETKLYDSSCRLIEQYAAGTATPKTNRTTYTYAGPFGLMDTSTTGIVTKSFTYDQFALNVTEERSDDGMTALSTTYTNDYATGLHLSFSGPMVVKKGGSPFAGPTGITRYYLYDAFGRTLAVAKAPFSATQVNSAVEAYQYLDTAAPRSVVSYRFSVPKTYSTSSSIPSTDDVAKSLAYRDGLGRIIQIRERLGGGGAADPAARVTQTLGGYKVAKAVLLDGAGRESVSLEPFFDPGEAFVDYRSVAIPATRGTVTTFDAQGRPWCSTHQYVSATAPGAATVCTSDSSNSSSYRLATETRYGSRFVSGRGSYGGYFVSVEVYPPDQNVSGGAMKPMVKFLGASGEELGLIDGEENRTWVERDAMGREVASWRESGGTYAGLSTPIPASMIRYNLAGQVVANWDANSTRVTRGSRYDEAGRLVYVTTDVATGEGIEYVYHPGDLGRVSEVTEWIRPTGGGPLSPRTVAFNHYDTFCDVADPGYSYLAGKLSCTQNDGPKTETQIAYGYDDAGRVWRRDQWFAKLDSAQRFTVSSTYGADGRVLDSRVVNPYSAAAEYQYLVDYDSAGRPVALSGKLASQKKLTKVYQVVPSQGPSNGYGGYDALGRVPLMRADDGRVVSARRYNAFSGALEGECKRFGDAVACGSVSGSVFGAPPALDPAKDVFRTDQVAATYRGAKLASYVDSGTATSYTNTYLPNGRLSTSQAAPTATVGSLTQDWLETFFFNGIGNIDRVDAQRNAASGNSRSDRYETERYLPESPAPGQALDRVLAVMSRLSETSGGTVIKGTAAATPGSTSYSYDLLGHLTKVTRTSGESETLTYAPGGELLYRQVGERFTFYMGEYATVTASGTPGCGSACVPQPGTVEVDAHVVFAGTRIASVKPSRTLYYYRTRLGTVVATSLAGGVPGAG